MIAHPTTHGSARRERVKSTRTTRMHDVLRRHVDDGELPGLVAIVGTERDARIETLGTLAFDDQAPMRTDTIFRLASGTKPITAVATMLLVDECTLRLDDPIDGWLPELANRKVLRTPASALDDVVPAARPITLRDLLTFRSGYGEAMFLAGNCPMAKAMAEARLPLSEWLFADSTDVFMKRLGALPLLHQPGEKWTYHMSAEILGVLVARASGKSFGAFLRERIFDPLGMKDTSFDLPASKVPRLAACYFTDPSTGKVAPLVDARPELFVGPRAFESGAGGLLSTADDLLAFGRMLVSGGVHGRERILSRATLAVMTADHLTPEQKALSPFFPNFWDARGWGLGVGVITRPWDIGRTPGSFGWDGAFGTSLWVDPIERIVGVLMTQRRPDWLRAMMPTVVQDFWTTAYQQID